jgi:hypothetical protein
MNLHFVETMDEVLKFALEREPEALPLPTTPAIELPVRSGEEKLTH